MKEIRTSTKIIIYNIWLYLIIALFFLPFFGELGKAIFMPLGKYYYIVVFMLTIINFICRFFFCKALINNIFVNKKYVNYIIGILLIILILGLFYCVLLNDAVTDFVFLLALLYLAFFFISYKFNRNNLVVLSYIASILLLAFFLISLIDKFDYFNPNTYAEVATVLFLFSCIGYVKSYKHIILLLINFVVALYTAELIYGSETQLFTMLFFIAIFILRSVIMKNQKACKSIVLMIWMFVICLPIIVYGLIKLNIVSPDIFSTRGDRWVGAIEAIIKYGVFSTNIDVPGAHNGFLDMSMKYTCIVSVVLVIFTIKAYIRCSKYIVKSDEKRIMLCSILSIVFMNCVESIFVGLTDCYFLLILTGILISLCMNEKKRLGEM